MDTLQDIGTDDTAVMGTDAAELDGQLVGSPISSPSRPLISPLISPLGRHLIVEYFGATNLHDPAGCDPVFRTAAAAAGATVLDVQLHDFGARAGFTGLGLLAESHISIHTWPEHDYAAIDIFMCGDADPALALPALEAYFQPDRVSVQTLKRGHV